MGGGFSRVGCAKIGCALRLYAGTMEWSEGNRRVAIDAQKGNLHATIPSWQRGYAGVFRLLGLETSDVGVLSCDQHQNARARMKLRERNVNRL